MTKEDFIKYIMKTPENANPNVMRTLLDKIESQEDSSPIKAFDFSEVDSATTEDKIALYNSIAEVYETAPFIVAYAISEEDSMIYINTDRMLGNKEENVFKFQSSFDIGGAAACIHFSLFSDGTVTLTMSTYGGGS